MTWGRSALYVAATVGCVCLAGSSFTSASDRPPIVFLADRDYPPLTYLEDGIAKGVDVDIAKALGTTLGREVRIEMTDWAVAQEKVLVGEADALLSMSMSRERSPLYDFTEPVLTHDFGVFVRKGETTVHGLAGLENSTVGVTAGGLPRTLLSKDTRTNLVLIRHYDDGFERLAARTIDAVAADLWVGAYTIERHRIPDIVTTGRPFATLPAGIAVRKGNAELLAEINRGILTLKADGTIAEIQERWRSQEIVFVSRQRMAAVAIAATGVFLLVAVAGMALWIATLRKQVRARARAESALRDSEQSLRRALSDAEAGRRAEEKIRLLAHALQSANDCITITDVNDHILYVNEAFLRTYEYEQHQLIGNHISLVRAADNNPEVVDGILEATKRDGWRGVVLNRSRTGRVFPVSLTTSMVHDENGQVVAAVGVARDMTSEHASESALRASEAKYRDVVENANDIIFTVDREGYCLSMNRAGREISGYSADEPRGINLRELVVPEQADMAWRQLQRVLSGDTVPRFELEIVGKHGRRLTLELDVRPILAAGRITGVQGIARDVSMRKDLEAQLRQAQKMEAIGLLAGGIAHDFNNLLTAVLGYADLAAQQIDPESPVHEDLEEIQRAARSAAALTRQLLIFSRKSVVHPTVLDLNEIVIRLERMLRRIVGEHIEFEVRPGRDVGNIKADAGQIEQVIMNLVVNARDAMPAGGRLTIETDALLPHNANTTAHPRLATGEFVRLTVTDSGSGMTPEVQAQIFTPFFTTKETTRGTGLGLATVHGIVEQAGGFISVDSAPGRGATFTVHLPRVVEPAESVISRSRSTDTAAASETILFVEDEESIRTLGVRLLRKYGYTVLPARHADDALKQAGEFRHHIDLLVTDIVMPGLSGPDLAEILQRSRPKLKVLYTSGYADHSEERRTVHAEPADFVQKPYSPETLARHVRAILDRG